MKETKLWMPIVCFLLSSEYIIWNYISTVPVSLGYIFLSPAVLLLSYWDAFEKCSEKLYKYLHLRYLNSEKAIVRTVIFVFFVNAVVLFALYNFFDIEHKKDYSVLLLLIGYSGIYVIMYYLKEVYTEWQKEFSGIFKEIKGFFKKWKLFPDE